MLFASVILDYSRMQLINKKKKKTDWEKGTIYHLTPPNQALEIVTKQCIHNFWQLRSITTTFSTKKAFDYKYNALTDRCFPLDFETEIWNGLKQV